MPLRDINMDDDDRANFCRHFVGSLEHIVVQIENFRQHEVLYHARIIDASRDRLSRVLDKALGKDK